ncbi:hypothetical protein CHS0354_021211 [Potamilus streckersoni]|uniref:Endonuclease 8-like 3 n=1 Tax=Potamilus streckersoni TaxID=2493646 RepID=A0AAE0W0Y3_9BIVA|nr:hypothetical protein CHS0354_021211 [Potamilus streckersoni]
MVEGPCCKIKGEKIKGRLKGQTVKNVSGNATDREIRTKKDDTSFHQLIGRKLCDVQTLGKELFMYFGDLCLRVHFLMVGQFFINNQKTDNDLGGTTDRATFELHMSRDLLTFKKCSVDVRNSEACKQKYVDLNDLDICSPIFNFKRAVALVMEQLGRLVCDVLLDQSVLPGVGNIIKNEALFDSGIRPNTKVEELSEKHVSHLVKMTRDFTMIFYKCRKEGKMLQPYMKIYKKRKCGQCEGKVIICRLGDDNKRVTYYCEACQTNDLKKSQRKLPTKNSLLGWVKMGEENDSEKKNWTCQQCTVINKPGNKNCEVCLAPQSSKFNLAVNETHSEDLTWLKIPSVPNFQSQTVSNSSESSNVSMPRKRKGEDLNEAEQEVSKRPKVSNTFGEFEQNASAHVKTKYKFKRVNLNTSMSSNSPSAMNNQNQNKYINVKNFQLNLTGPSQLDATIVKSNQVLQNHRQSNIRVQERSQSESNMQASEKKIQSDLNLRSRIPLCPDHKKKCTIIQVFKKGPNYGRWFFSCSFRSCKFFEWADVGFPICSGHGKPCTIRTVMKYGSNNGKKFFVCQFPKNKQCDFFEWALGYD